MQRKQEIGRSTINHKEFGRFSSLSFLLLQGYHRVFSSIIAIRYMFVMFVFVHFSCKREIIRVQAHREQQKQQAEQRRAEQNNKNKDSISKQRVIRYFRCLPYYPTKQGNFKFLERNKLQIPKQYDDERVPFVNEFLHSE